MLSGVLTQLLEQDNPGVVDRGKRFLRYSQACSFQAGENTGFVRRYGYLNHVVQSIAAVR